MEDFTNKMEPFSEGTYFIDFNLGAPPSITAAEAPPMTSDGASKYPTARGPSSSNENTDKARSQSHSSAGEPLIRKSHAKSRRGCYNCKRRRIKCEENPPTCTQCSRKNLMCEWPEIQIVQSNIVARRNNAIPIPKPLASQDSTFTIQDFRLFNHFIQKCYPHQPIGNDSIWQHEIPSIAHNYDFLLHAMLALSASDLNPNQTDRALATCAMSHRLNAIRSLNRALSSPNLTSESCNAMLATCYTLVFQSVLIDEGLAEYMTFIRGCVLVLYQMGARNLKLIFHTVLSEDVMRKMDPKLEQMPEVDLEAARKALRSLEAFSGLCDKEIEREFHGHLMAAAKGLFSSAKEAYSALQKIYEVFSWKMSHADFQYFIDPSNAVGQLLQSHFVAVQTLLSPITLGEQGSRDDNPNGSVRWLRIIHQNIQPEMRGYFQWPIEQAQEVVTPKREVVEI